MAATLAFPAFAAETEKIEEVTLIIESNITVGETESIDSVEVDVDTEGCYVDWDNLTITNEPDDGWDEDDKPKLKVIVKAEEGYAFSTALTKDNVYLDDEEGTVSGFSRSTSKVTITVTLPPVEEYEDDYDDYDLEMERSDLAWDAADGGMAYWSGNDYAKRYEVRLYRDGELVTNTLTTTENSYNFSSYFTKSGNYTFRVRAVRSSSMTGSWVTSEVLEVSSAQAAGIYGNGSSNSSEGAWLQDGTGYWWCRVDRTWPASQWEQINGIWYYFNAGGYRIENDWINLDGKFYYLGENGVMYANTWTPDGYYVGGDGAWDGAAAR